MWLESVSRIVTLIITNCIKLAGAFLAVHIVLTEPHPEALALAVSALMMAGGQVSETAIIAILERFFGVPKK